MIKALEAWGLHIAPEKVQQTNTVQYLGAHISPNAVRPQKITLRHDKLKTLNDFQKLLGDINWIRTYLRLPNHIMKPLYDILKGDSDLASPRSLTPEARKALREVEQVLQQAGLVRWQEGKDLLLSFYPPLCSQLQFSGRKDLCSGPIHTLLLPSL